MTERIKQTAGSRIGTNRWSGSGCPDCSGAQLRLCAAMGNAVPYAVER